ncbi:UNVERIFIED_CONTAM: hypothetical protein Sradi_1944900 [Sesamum radiatum]|uniref:DUF4283 domain-containing protein n=1 Tax=Sesamum radiatum TaxID=300843 RepID=A0AAW2TE53_SESRA
MDSSSSSLRRRLLWNKLSNEGHGCSEVPVWIKLRHLPVELWTDEGLSTVASGIGIPFYPDAISQVVFARVFVMPDISLKLPKHIVIVVPHEDGRETTCKVDVEYEWLPPKCNSCISLGHAMKACPANKPPKPVVSVYVQKATVPSRQPHPVAATDEPGDDVGEQRELWLALVRLAEVTDTEPWLVGDNFNAVLDMSEVCGASGDIRVAMDDFQGCITQI